MDRRTILKVAGATSILPVASGTTMARRDEDENGDNETGQRERACQRPNCIHPTLGYAGLEPDEKLPAPLQPDHEVDLITRSPEEEGGLPEFFFQPTGLHVSEGDVVRFNLAAPDHTVTAYHPGLGRQRRVPEGVPPFSSPVLAGGTFWLYRFDEPGVYDMLCSPHEIFGMVGRIVVGETGSQPDFGDTGSQLRPPEFTAALVFEDPALDPENIKKEGEVAWEDLADESKEILVELPEEGGG